MGSADSPVVGYGDCFHIDSTSAENVYSSQSLDFLEAVGKKYEYSFHVLIHLIC